MANEEAKSTDHIGERRMMNCGMWAEIIEYVRYKDITVRFEDGVVVAHKTYDSFVSGHIKNPNYNAQALTRIGERRMMNCGMEAEITEYISARDITVKFADGAIARHKTYDAFQRGKIQNPNFINYQERVGERRMMNCGMEAEIIEYNSCSDITVKFSDGTVVYHKSYEKFVNGGIQNPNCPNTLLAKNTASRIGECRLMNCGMKAEIIEYNDANDITVRFEDGTIVAHKAYGSFRNGTIANPNCTTIFTSIAETALHYYLAQYGYEKAPQGSLKQYGLGRLEIDVLNKSKGIGIEYDSMLHRKHLERDARKNNLFFKAFKRLIRIRDFRLPCDDKRVEYYKIDTNQMLSKEYETTIKNVFRNLGLQIDVNFARDKDKIYDLYHKSSPRTRLGEKRRMNNGLMAEIIKYRSAGDIDVRFEDGFVKNTRYSAFIHGKVAHPNYAYHAKERLGMRILMNCGMYAEIIEYFSATNITIRFDDGAVVTHKAYENFAKGAIAHPHTNCPTYKTRKSAAA